MSGSAMKISFKVSFVSPQSKSEKNFNKKCKEEFRCHCSQRSNRKIGNFGYSYRSFMIIKI